jgi:hypothetical protein
VTVDLTLALKSPQKLPFGFSNFPTTITINTNVNPIAAT